MYILTRQFKAYAHIGKVMDEGSPASLPAVGKTFTFAAWNDGILFTTSKVTGIQESGDHLYFETEHAEYVLEAL